MSAEITKQFFDWIFRGNTGCMFAQRYARAPAGPPHWASSVVPGGEDYPRIASVIQTFLSGAVGTAEAAQVILPDIRSGVEIVNLINALCAMPNWFCSASEHQNQFLLVGLRWLLPDNQHLNWVLGFANLDSMPPTRRSPYTALIVRPGVPGRAPSVARSNENEVAERELDRGKIPVHLADMDTNMTDEEIKRFWGITQAAKARKLQADPLADAAKARVTFSLPLECKDMFNCISGAIREKQ